MAINKIVQIDKRKKPKTALQVRAQVFFHVFYSNLLLKFTFFVKIKTGSQKFYIYFILSIFVNPAVV
jgi:hypothetical protein